MLYNELIKMAMYEISLCRIGFGLQRCNEKLLIQLDGELKEQPIISP